MKFNVYHLLFCSLFLGAIYIPFTVAVFEDDQAISEIEKRTLKQVPDFPKNVQSFIDFPESFENYYQDNFGFREILTKQYRFLKYKIGDSPSQDVTIGKDGFLFLGTVKKGYSDRNDPMGDYRGINKYTPEELSKFVTHMDDLNTWFAVRGIKYVFVIAPNKATIYPEKLPKYIQKVNQETAYDQLVSALKTIDDFLIVDLRPALLNEKSKGNLYYKTDTHWNFAGANAGQREIISRINDSTENSIDVINTEIKSQPWDGGDLANFIGVKPLNDQMDDPHFPQACNPSIDERVEGAISITSFSCDSKNFNVLVFGDSFSGWLRPFFSRTFNKSTFVPSGALVFSMTKNLIQESKPDFVIEEWVERVLPHTPFIEEVHGFSKEKRIFDSSSEVIYHNNFSMLQLINLLPVRVEQSSIELRSAHAAQALIFPEISFKQGKKYSLKIRIHSSIDSFLQVFFSESNMSENLFSEKNSVRKSIIRGENELYIQLNNLNLGKALRLDPLEEQGSVIISELTIKEIDIH